MDYLMPQLLVGARSDAEDADALRCAGVDALVSLAPVSRPAGVKRQLSLELADRVALPASAVREVVDFVRARLTAGERVLMHCEMGISRSPALALCVLHELSGAGIDEALRRVRAARPLADPHPALLDSIRELYGDERAAVDLAGNENPLGPSPRALAALADGLAGLHRYPERDNHELLARLSREVGLGPEHLVPGNGACELIDLATRCCLADGGEVLIPEPAFPAYRSAARRIGARVVTAPMPGGRYRVDEIVARLGAQTRLVVVASPHNPTGSLLSPADWRTLVDALPPAAWLLLDEAYRDYAAPHELIDALPDVRAGRRVLVLRSLSKVHGLAGLRFGYGIAPAGFAARLAALCPQYHIGRLAQLAACAALDDRAHVARSIEANRRGREILTLALTRMGVEYLPSAANFVVLRGPSCERFAALGVRVKDMARYGMPGHVRVSVGTDHENTRFLRALARLQREDENAGAVLPA